MKVVVTGASGMIGSTLARVISNDNRYDVVGVGRRKLCPDDLGFDYRVFGSLSDKAVAKELFQTFQPDVVINCAGLTKHHKGGNQPLNALEANALLPHLLGVEATKNQCRLIHISTDCVFSGESGNYCENSHLDALDIYGKSKGYGELIGENHLVLRTSTIGHENDSCFGLLEWFLSRDTTCKGFTDAYFSGLPTLELANILTRLILPKDDFLGIYNIGGARISKHTLLTIISEVYDHKIKIERSADLKIDRSLNISKFIEKTGYQAPSWEELIREMFVDWRIRNK